MSFARLVFASVIVALSQQALANPTVTAGKLQQLRVAIRATMAAEHAPGATFAIGLNGKIVWTEGFGYADVENKVKAAPDTSYRTASIGKSMTATAAMELWEQGKLDLDAPIQKYCPAFPEKQWPVTTRELLSHTSGIREPNETSELYNTKHYDRVSDSLAIFANDPLTMQPGADFHYTTWGYVVLGCVLEGATGEEYRALMKRMIFDSAGMTSTREDDPRAIIPNRARGYIVENGVLKNSGWADMSAKLPAGGWVTTASDLVRFMQTWMDGRFVSPKTQALMLTPYVLPRHGGTVDGYGMGWFLDDYHGMRAGFHGGGTPQVSGIAYFVPEKQVAIAGIFNLQNIAGQTRIALAQRLADIVLGMRTAKSAP
jgi:CubicO group peptidase (beta-lactamase class C family)